MNQRPEIISLLGVPHYARPAEGEALVRLQDELSQAVGAMREAPDDVERRILYGRRLAYLWRYHEAIASYSETLTALGESDSLLRHRGHRFISVRRYGPAARDLARADELKPRDFDICYHLGLARWLLGDYAGARRAYESCLPHCADDESRVALTYWLALAGWRLGDRAAVERLLADVGSPAVSENRHYLDMLSLFRGERREADVRELARENALAAGTLGFGLGLWHYLNGRPEQAAQSYIEVVAGSYWPSFGFIAAETELARLQGMLPV